MINHHFLDIFEERDMAEPPDLMETEPFEESMSTELGALLGRSMLFSFKKSSISGPRSGRSSPMFLYKRLYTWEMILRFCFCLLQFRTKAGPDEDCYHWFLSSSCSSCFASKSMTFQLCSFSPGAHWGLQPVWSWPVRAYPFVLRELVSWLMNAYSIERLSQSFCVLLIFLLKFLQFILFLEQILTGSITLLFQCIFLGEFWFRNSLLTDFGSQVDVSICEWEQGILEALQLLLGFVDFATQLIPLSLQFLSLLGSLYHVISLWVFCFSIFRAV